MPAILADGGISFGRTRRARAPKSAPRVYALVLSYLASAHLASFIGGGNDNQSLVRPTKLPQYVLTHSILAQVGEVT